jgi:hypothetical protein
LPESELFAAGSGALAREVARQLARA